MNRQPVVSIVVPCYNEAGNIPTLLSAYDTAITRDDIEIILVNTISTDNSEAILNELQPKYERFLRVIHTSQKGYGAGILMGLHAARGIFIGWTHGDLQTPPTDIIKAVSILEKNGKDKTLYIKGLRKKRPFVDTFFTLGMSIFESLYLREKLFDINAQPNIFHRDFFTAWENPPSDFSLDLFSLYEAKRTKRTIIRFPVLYLPRTHGHSSWNTGFFARWPFIKRTLSFSTSLKKRFK